MTDDTSFRKRGQTFEAGFAHGENAEFRTLALRNQKLGAWAAQLMGIKGAEAEAYISRLIEFSINDPGEDALSHRISMDFEASRVDSTARTIRRQMADLMVEASEEIRQGPDQE